MSETWREILAEFAGGDGLETLADAVGTEPDVETGDNAQEKKDIQRDQFPGLFCGGRYGYLARRDGWGGLDGRDRSRRKGGGRSSRSGRNAGLLGARGVAWFRLGGDSEEFAEWFPLGGAHVASVIGGGENAAFDVLEDGLAGVRAEVLLIPMDVDLHACLRLRGLRRNDELGKNTLGETSFGFFGGRIGKERGRDAGWG